MSHSLEARPCSAKRQSRASLRKIQGLCNEGPNRPDLKRSRSGLRIRNPHVVVAAEVTFVQVTLTSKVLAGNNCIRKIVQNAAKFVNFEAQQPRRWSGRAG